MANTCITSWILCGAPEAVTRLRAHLETAVKSAKGIYGSQSPAHIHNILLAAGYDREAIQTDCCGEVYQVDPEETPGVLRFHTEDAWSPKTGAMALLARRFGIDKVRYAAECFEDDLFETNDAEGEHFTARYALDFETSLQTDLEPVAYFDTEDELLEAVNRNFKTDYNSADQVECDLEDHMAEDLGDEDAWVSLHRMTISDELR